MFVAVAVSSIKVTFPPPPPPPGAKVSVCWNAYACCQDCVVSECGFSMSGMHMLSERRAVIADAKTNVATVPHHHQSTVSGPLSL